MAQTVKRLSTMRETQVRALGWEDPLEKESNSIFKFCFSRMVSALRPKDRRSFTKKGSPESVNEEVCWVLCQFSLVPSYFSHHSLSISKVRASDSNTTPEYSIHFFVLYQLIV